MSDSSDNGAAEWEGDHQNGPAADSSAESTPKESQPDELTLAESVFDAAVVGWLWKPRRRTLLRLMFWYYLSLLLQLGLSYFLYTQLNPNLAPNADYLQNDEDTDAHCAWLSTTRALTSGKFKRLEGFPSDSLVCIHYSLIAAQNFSILDHDGDGRWTFAEASSHGMGLTELYFSLMEMMQEVASSVSTTPCRFGDEVDAYIEDRGYAYPVRIIGQQNHPQKAILVQQLSDDMFKRSDATMLYKRDNWDVRCRMPGCVDTDHGRTDKGGGPCAWYYYEGMHMLEKGNDISVALAGDWDDDDFVGTKLCCFLGGGSKSPNSTGLDMYLVNIALPDFLQVSGYYSCREEKDKETCLTKYSFIPEHFYKQEIEPVVGVCMLLDEDLCGNLLAANAWPGNHIHSWVEEIVANASIPMFLKLAGIYEMSRLRPRSLCETIVRDFCPRLFTELQTWNADRLETCGRSTIESEQQQAVVRYHVNDQYNGPMSVRSLMFQSFLALIVLLWAMAMLPEMRQILLWWDVLTGLPVTPAGQNWVVRSSMSCDAADKHFVLASVARRHQAIIFIFILIPQTITLSFIYVLGIQYLLVVRDISDLILNSLALTFLVTIDDMLFLAFGADKDRRLLQSIEPFQTQRGCLRSMLKALASWRVPFGFAVFIPLCVVVAGLFLHEVDRARTVGNMLRCLCTIRGQMCFVSHMLGGDLLNQE